MSLSAARCMTSRVVRVYHAQQELVKAVSDLILMITVCVFISHFLILRLCCDGRFVRRVEIISTDSSFPSADRL